MPLTRWDVSGWRGGDRQRFWFKSEGALEGGRRAPGDVDVQALYGRLISPYFDVQAGVRVEQRRRGPAGAPVRTFAVIGLDGLAPYHVDVEPALFVSHTGKVSGRFTASYDLLLTQRLVAQGRVEATISAQRDVAFGVDRGFDDAEIGIRLRHELSRELAPYIGVSFNRQFGGLAEAGRGGEWQAAVGLRAWF